LLEGEIEDFGADVLIRLISGSQKSGRLQLRRAFGQAELMFSSGSVCSAFSSFAGEPLGVRLVGDGSVSRRRLRVALDEHVKQQVRLGQVLVEEGDIATEYLDVVLRAQMMDRILDILEWETGTFMWAPVDEIRLDDVVVVTAREIFNERVRRAEAAGTVIQQMIDTPGATGGRGPEEFADGHDPSANVSWNLNNESSKGVFDVVVVCTGNQFRSPIVEGLMKASTSRLPLRVTSVGTKDLGAAPALPEAVDLASEFGVDLSEHRARSLNGINLSGADLVIGFEQAHVAAAVVEAGASYDRTFTILELISLLEDVRELAHEDPIERATAAVAAAHRRRPPDSSRVPRAQISDPIGLGSDVYRHTADRLQSLTRQLLSRLFGYVPLSPPPP